MAAPPCSGECPKTCREPSFIKTAYALSPLNNLTAPELISGRLEKPSSVSQVTIELPEAIDSSEEKVISVVLAPLHKIWLSIASASGVGFTVIVKVWEVPWLLIPPFSKVGVTVIVATTGIVPVLTAVNVGRLPVPEDERPIDSVSFVQAKVVLPPVFKLSNSTESSSPLQTTWSSTVNIVTGGLTVTVYSCITGSQSAPSKLGVIV